MKRVLYIFLAVGLAASLVGCGGGSGGYWPMNPTAPAGVPVGGPVGGMVVAPAVLGVGANGVAAGGAIANTNAGIGGCPVFADFGVSMPVSLGQGSLPTFFASVLGSSRSRKVSQAVAGLSLSAQTGWTRIAYSTESTSAGYSAEFEYYVRFLKSDGTVLTYTGSTTSTDDFYKFSNGTAADVNTIEWYGSYEIHTSYAGSSAVGSVLASTCCTSSPVYDYMLQVFFGSQAAPNVLTNLLGQVVHQKFVGQSKVTGSYDGATYDTASTFELGGDASMFGYSGLFGNAPSYGNGFYRLTDQGGSVSEMKAYDGEYYEWFVNGELQYSSRQSSSQEMHQPY